MFGCVCVWNDDHCALGPRTRTLEDVRTLYTYNYMWVNPQTHTHTHTSWHFQATKTDCCTWGTLVFPSSWTSRMTNQNQKLTTISTKKHRFSIRRIIRLMAEILHQFMGSWPTAYRCPCGFQCFDTSWTREALLFSYFAQKVPNLLGEINP